MLRSLAPGRFGCKQETASNDIACELNSACHTLCESKRHDYQDLRKRRGETFQTEKRPLSHESSVLDDLRGAEPVRKLTCPELSPKTKIQASFIRPQFKEDRDRSPSISLS
jgi:hypothetical protein